MRRIAENIRGSDPTWDVYLSPGADLCGSRAGSKCASQSGRVSVVPGIVSSQCNSGACEFASALSAGWRKNTAGAAAPCSERRDSATYCQKHNICGLLCTYGGSLLHNCFTANRNLAYLCGVGHSLENRMRQLVREIKSSCFSYWQKIE